ncbi:MAG TPA: hypothetical protein PKJ39_06315, partial [Caldisericia bacterium]|nr:hypothetical protein [Caldisericia bacterium]HQP00162.1 hypothetical protein [Caldisericia bacterium]
MINPEWLNSFLGFFMPVLVNYIINKNFSREIKTIIAIITSLLIGFLSTYLQGLFCLSLENFFNTFIQIFTISQIAY